MADHRPGGQAPAQGATQRLEKQGGKLVSWELGRLRQTLPMLVRRAMGYTARTCFDPSLIAAVREFYGLDMDVDGVEKEIFEDPDERIRFLPWFIWDWREEPGLPTVGERFRTEGSLNAYEGRLVEALCASSVGFYQALSDAIADGVPVIDLATGTRLHIDDEGLEGELLAGQLLQARLVSVSDAAGDARVVVDAVYAVLPAQVRAIVDAEIASLGTEAEDVSEGLKAYASEMLEFSEHLLESLARPPIYRNGDGDTLVVCETALRGSVASDVEAVLTRDGLKGFAPVRPGAWSWNQDGAVRGVVFREGRHRLVACTTSLARHDEMEGLLREAIGSTLTWMRCITNFESMANRWVGGHTGDPILELLPEIRAAMETWLSRWASRWVDRPLTELGRRTPREAVHQSDGRLRVEHLIEGFEARHPRGLDTPCPDDVTGLRAKLGL